MEKIVERRKIERNEAILNSIKPETTYRGETCSA